jgi:hypothetical protein
MGFTTGERFAEMAVGLEMGRQMVQQMRCMSNGLPPGLPGAIPAFQNQSAQSIPPIAPPALPPQGPAAIWFVAIQGKQAGPFTEAEIKDLLETAKIDRKTLVWKQGMTGWAAAEDTPEILKIIMLMPPPVPHN